MISTSTSPGKAARPHAISALRERLVFMRTDLVKRLTKEGIDGGMLALLGSVGAAIAALDAIPTERLAGD
jgi:hypothetical protein